MSYNKILLIFLFLLLILLSASVLAQERDLEYLARVRAHHHNPGFLNPWLPEGQTGHFSRFLKWKFGTNPYEEEKKNPPTISFAVPPVDDILKRGDSITYLGHGTLWIRIGGKNILTDPIFGNIWPFLDRKVPFPLPTSLLPSPDVVVISHSHYDHLDKDTLRSLGVKPLYLLPLKHKDWFADVLPGARIVELDWFETHTVSNLTFRLLPTQHWSKRTPWDTNRRLWGAWLIEGNRRRVFFGGDSGYFQGFKEYGAKYGPLDAALLPIGAYEPRWFMKTYHMNPEEAVKALQDLQARVIIPQQWGVFDLTDEPLDLPYRDYLKAAKDAGLGENQTPYVPHGGTWYFP